MIHQHLMCIYIYIYIYNDKKKSKIFWRCLYSYIDNMLNSLENILIKNHVRIFFVNNNKYIILFSMKIIIINF